METILILAASLLIAASALAWIAGGLRLAGGRSLLAVAPRRAVPWGPVEIVATVLLLFVVQGFLVSGARIAYRVGLDVPADELPAAARAASFFAGALGSLLTLGLSVIAVRLRTGASWRDLGFTGDRLYRDMGIGLIAFVMLAPAVYAIQYLLVQWFPSEHPLAEFLQANPSVTFLAVCTFSAVVVAPVAEEYFFRVLVQGWFERLAGVAGAGTDEEALGPRQAETAEIEDGYRDLSNPYAPPSSPPVVAEKGPSTGSVAARPVTPFRLWPIVSSSVLFAVVHWRHGPDPIPLCLLALGLGYLYQRTHRILPGVVVHTLLNAISMMLLLIEIGRGL